MSTMVMDEYPEPGKFASAVLAVLVHIALFALLFFGVQWKSAEAPSVEVELWSSPPPPAPAIVQPVPVPVPVLDHILEPPVEPAKVEDQVAPPVIAKPVVEPKPEPKVEPKPDIALQKQKEKERKKKEEAQKLEKQKQELAAQEKTRQEKVKQEQAILRAQAQKERSEQIRKEQQLQVAQRQAAEEQNQRNAQRAAAVKRGADEYKAKIQAKIRSNIVIPEGIVGNPEAVFDVVQIPSGDIISAKLRKSSGNAAYDAAVERAILKSSPLPKPGEPGLFERDLQLKFTPRDRN